MSSPEYTDQGPEADRNQSGQKLPDLESDFYEAFFMQASTGAIPIQAPEAELATPYAVSESPVPAHQTLEMPSWRLMADGEETGAVEESHGEDDMPVARQLHTESADDTPLLEGVLVSGNVHRRRPAGRLALAAAVLVAAGGTTAVALDKSPSHGPVGAAVGQAVPAATAPRAVPSSSVAAPSETQSPTPSTSATPKTPTTPPGPEVILLPSDSPGGMEFTMGSHGWLVDTLGGDEVQLTPPGDTSGAVIALGRKVTITDSAQGKSYVVKVDLNAPSRNNESAKSATVYVYGQQG